MLEQIKSRWHKLPFRWQAGILAGLLGVIVIIILLWQKSPGVKQPTSPAESATFTVKEGPLTISVVESGTIKAREQEIIKSEVEGKTSIIWIIEEGVRVKKGELLIELDASKLQDDLVDQQIKVQNSEAEYVRARENLDVVKNQAQSDIDKAELAFQFAKQDLKKYLEGEYPNELKEAESKITLAREELRRAEEKLKWSKQLYDEKYLSQTELQADELAAKRAQLDLDLAENNLELLKEYTYTRKVDELESDVKQTEMALSRTHRKAKADIVQAEAELRAKESILSREQDKLNKIKDQIAKTKIYASTDGLVIYSTTAKASWRGNEEPLAAGQEVSERQELIYLPRTALMEAEVKVHESNLDKVQEGLPVKVTVDALPGKVFEGTVTSISPLPDASIMWFNPNLKLYTTVINLNGATQGLRTGMSCQAEILVEQYEKAVYVPLQAVIRVGGETVTFVKKANVVEKRPVSTGLNNNRMVRILGGLQAGEEVLLTPPLEQAAKPAAEIPTRQSPNGEKGINPLKPRPERNKGD